MKESYECPACGLDHTGSQRILSQHGNDANTCPFRGPHFIQDKPTRESLLQYNTKQGHKPKDFHRHNDITNRGPQSAKLPRPTGNSGAAQEHIHDEYTRDDGYITAEDECTSEADDEASSDIPENLGENFPAPVTCSGIKSSFHNDLDEEFLQHHDDFDRIQA